MLGVLPFVEGPEFSASGATSATLGPANSVEKR